MKFLWYNINMKVSFKTILYIICAVIYLTLTTVIFVEALKSGEKSTESSDGVIETVADVYDFCGGDREEFLAYVEHEEAKGPVFLGYGFKGLIRKSIGHFGLFGALAVFAFPTYLPLFLRLFKGKGKYAFSILVIALIGLLTASISECLQLPIFTSGRSGEIKDIFIDFSGYILGIIFDGIILLIIKAKERKSVRP